MAVTIQCLLNSLFAVRKSAALTDASRLLIATGWALHCGEMRRLGQFAATRPHLFRGLRTELSQVAGPPAGASFFVMVVSEIMTPAPYTVEVTQSAREAMLQLSMADIRHLPVLDDGTLVGMVSDRDLRGLSAQVLTGSDLSDMLDVPVSEIMSSDVLTVAPEADVTEVIELMLEHRVGALPVVSDSQLLGVVSYVDVLREAQSALG